MLKKRSDINVKHFVNLMYRATQYILIYYKSEENIADFNKEKWESNVLSLLNSQDSLQVFQELLEKEYGTIKQKHRGWEPGNFQKDQLLYLIQQEILKKFIILNSLLGNC